MKTMLDLPRIGSEPDAPFPPCADALTHPNGLLAWGGDLHPQRLLGAYRKGIFPWYSEGQPILWWSPAPRCVIFPDKLHLSRRTRRRYNSGRFRVTLNQAFAQVIEQCAAPRDGEAGTWITEDMLAAYLVLHHQAYAHSVEVWDGASLAGGIYGLAIGSVFFGESMFSRQTDASKIALTALCEHLVSCSYRLLDCQVSNPHLMSMGAVEISRGEFENRLAEWVNLNGSTACWTGGLQVPERW
jgi:leucyl/phenylalanyl-tRNA--protein transferase